MFLCSGCGEFFEIPKTVFDGHGFTLPPFEKWELCPYCSSSNIIKADGEEEENG